MTHNYQEPADSTTNHDDHDVFRVFLVKVLDNEEEVLVTGAQKVGVNRLFVTFRGKAYWLVIE